MTLEELYTKNNSNFNVILERIPSKTLILKLLKMLPSDPNKALIDEAIQNKDAVAAFNAIHTLKGVSLNLGLESLIVPLVPLTEKFRGGTFEEGWEELYQSFSSAFVQLIDDIFTLNE